MDVCFHGEQAHTGPTKMRSRRDALFAAAQTICDVRDIADRWPDRIHTSVGRLVVQPNSPNVVPARADLSIELRALDDDILRSAEELATQAIQKAAAKANVRVDVSSRTARPIRSLPSVLSDLIKLCAAETGHVCREIDTVSGHDALSLLDVCPTGLLFVPSVGGIAHNEREETHPDDVDRGMAVLTRVALRLCQSRGDPKQAAL
jgi:beta-ureidopropionase / N-carbamoyl-L-amino-acid hydrolase